MCACDNPNQERTLTVNLASSDIAGARLYHVSGTLTPCAPFDFAQTLAFAGAFSPTAGEQRTLGDGALRKAVALDGRAIVFTVQSEGAVEQPRLAYTLTSADPLTAADEAALRDRICFFLSLDDDLRTFYSRAQQDPRFMPVIERLYGLHQVKFLTPFENACWAVLTQRMPMRMARQVKDRLVARYGPALALEDGVYRAFPEPATLAAAEHTEFAALIRNERKVDYLNAVIAFFLEHDEAWLRAAPVDEVTAALRGVHGIGEWSTTFILVRGLGRMDAGLPSGEEMERAAARIYNNGKPLPPAEMGRLSSHYGTERGHWAFYSRNAFGVGAGVREDSMAV